MLDDCEVLICCLLLLYVDTRTGSLICGLYFLCVHFIIEPYTHLMLFVCILKGINVTRVPVVICMLITLKSNYLLLFVDS